MVKTTCALCGLEFEPFDPARDRTRSQSACSRCPLGARCATACCPRCGYTSPTPEGSALVRLIDRIFTRRSHP